MKTQFVDTFIDGTVHPERRHATPEAAHEYARDLTRRRKGECRVIGEFDEVVDVYEGGEVVAEASA